MTNHHTLDQAAALITDGMTVALGGMTLYRRPAAFCLALLRRAVRPRDLTLLGFTHGIDADWLVGGGCVSTVRTCYFGLEAFGLAPMFTEMATKGAVTVLEETEASIGGGLRAQMGGVGFMPSVAWLGTDLPALRPDVKTITDPYTGETLMAFPAIPVDVAVIHALEADDYGNVSINQNTAIDVELVATAKTVIITYERRVAELVKSADRLIIPSPVPDVLVHAPRGAWPTSCHPDYPLDGAAIMDYMDACASGDFEGYIGRVGER
ncbi:MAG: CoA transferase subunit A [Anaerolineae bacterium]|nr:CoA transferase subunit A [Anaerolineae bacterium]